MASGLEPIPVTSQKHDPAWKHCQMFKHGDKVQLKCMYCGKIFKGGGIHRIKEHLAGQKGNASTCLRVQPDVRLLMQESLNGVVAKKRKKQKLSEEMTNYIPPQPIEAEALVVDNNDHNDNNNNQCALNSEVSLAMVQIEDESNSLILVREDDNGVKDGGRRKKGRVRKASRSSAANNVVLNGVNMVKRINSDVSTAVGRFFYEVGIPLDALNSTSFQQMVDSIAAQGVGMTVPPSYHDLRGIVLKNSLQEVRNDVDQCMGTWGKNGCTLLVDEWVSQKGKIFVDFLVYCPQGTTFLRSVDLSVSIDSPDFLYLLLKEVVEEIGERNVLQVVTFNQERYSVAAKKLTDDLPTIFWTPCAAHSVDLILQDFSKLDWINTITEQSKSLSRFIHNHSVVLNMMRRYTYGVDLIDIGCTRYSTDFMTLKRMLAIKHNLQSMVTSEEWMESPFSKTQGGLAMLDCISSSSFWSSCALIVQLTEPVLRLIRIVSSEKRPAMGYSYAAIYRLKELIKKLLVDKKDYMVYWNIIDDRLGQLQYHPLLAAGFYLNPKYFYSVEGDVHHQIRSSVYDCIEKLVSDPKIQDKIVKETTSYLNAVGDFGRKMAVRARDTLLPDEWWSTYGGGCPNLARLAIRILSQTCSLNMCKPKRTSIEQMSETKNCLEHQRLGDLAFIQYNLQLRQMSSRKNREQQEAVDPTSYENIGVSEDWVMVKEECLDDYASSDWMAVDPPIGNPTLLGPATDDVEELGFEDYEIFEGVKECREDNDER
ncbi:uncharacterized protein LOC124919796 isoform X2 [Impatiens glandulifera]|uniref:uncharacterized protein LOC124919796 isoform X2 n=1 Tax=Impatiens glandulifera TaxID=253017 RepID=UPI001FB05CA5|nr:uncharacterized protein LOC124919796 isoform X2 [Impatiens glandulifera]